jgi:hypothetical protein
VGLKLKEAIRVTRQENRSKLILEVVEKAREEAKPRKNPYR